MGFLIIPATTSFVIMTVYSIRHALLMCWELVSGFLFLYRFVVSHLKLCSSFQLILIYLHLKIKENVSLINSILFCLLFPDHVKWVLVFLPVLLMMLVTSGN